MATNKYAVTLGTTLFYGTLGAAAATALAGIKSIGQIPGLDADEIDVSRIDQVLEGGAIDPVKQFAPGMSDPGLLEVTVGFDEDLVNTAYGMHRQPHSWKIAFSSGATLTFDGWIKSIKPKAAEKDEILYDLSIRVSGNHTFAKKPVPPAP